MHTNGLGDKLLPMTRGALVNALRGADKPSRAGAGVVLETRGNLARSGLVDRLEVDRRRAKNKAARKARRAGRR